MNYSQSLVDILCNPEHSLYTAEYRHAVMLLAQKPFASGDIIVDSDSLVLKSSPKRNKHQDSFTETPLSRILLNAGDGGTTLQALCDTNRLQREAIINELIPLLGRVLTIAEAEQLLSQVPVFQISRWPSHSLYAPRIYWRNCRDLLAYFKSSIGDVSNFESYVTHLRQAHIIYLLGSSRMSYYVPLSACDHIRSGRNFHNPGQLRLNDCPVRCYATGAIIPKLEFYLQSLIPSLGSARAENANRVARSEHGILCGESYFTWLESSTHDSPAFAYRPIDRMRALHLEALWNSFQRTRQKHITSQELLCALSSWFQLFVSLHPFPYGNMGIAMAWLNTVLAENCGTILPHGILDWFAVRLNHRDFSVFFARYVRQFSAAKDSLVEQSERTARLLAWRSFIELDAAHAKARLHTSRELRIQMLLE